MTIPWRALALLGCLAVAVSACDGLPEDLPIFVTPDATPAAGTDGGAGTGGDAAAPAESEARPGTHTDESATDAGAGSDATEGADGGAGGPAGAGSRATGVVTATGAADARRPTAGGRASEVVTATRGTDEGAGATGRTDEGAGATGGRSAAASAGGGPLAGDMLTAAEEARAAELALGSRPVDELVGLALDRDSLEAAAADGEALVEAMADRPSYRVLYTQRYPDKAAEARQAEVAVYRYDTGALSLSKVDLESGAVEALDVPPGFPVPIVPEEIAEAVVIARADERVRSALTDAGLDPEAAEANALLTIAEDPEAACATHRCLRLFFSSLRQPVPTFSVVVDLVTLQVEEVAPLPGSVSQP